MRVLHVTEVCIGGVSALVRAFADAQTGRGHEVHVLAPPLLEASAGTRHTWKVHRKKPLRLRDAVHRLSSVCQEVRPDVIHLHSFFGGLLGRVPSSVIGDAAVVYQPHSWNYDAARHRAQHVGLVAWERWASGRTDLVVVNCLDEKSEGLRNGVRAPIEVVGIPIDTDRFAPVAHEIRRRERVDLGLAADRTLLCLASLCWQKGQDRLVEAWEQSPVEGAELILVGGSEGPYLRRVNVTALRRLAPSQWGHTLHAVGPQQDVRPWIRAADVLVQPSRYEAMGVALAEALSCGVPVVTFAVNGAREAIEDGPEPPAGAVVPQGDVTDLVEACRSRLDDPQRRASEATAARARALRLFAVDAVTDRLEAAYGRAIALALARRSSRSVRR
jgi:glycosyltransferase involved in cell wall biosynthesis